MTTRRPIREVNLGKTPDITTFQHQRRVALHNLNRKATFKDTPLPTSPVEVIGAEQVRLGSKEAIIQDVWNFGIEGGGLVLGTGVVQGADFELPFNGHFTTWRVVGNDIGSIVLDIWKDSFANFPPTVAATITASAKPTLSSAQTAENTTLVGWIRHFIKGDWLRFNIDSVTTLTGCNLSLGVERD